MSRRPNYQRNQQRNQPKTQQRDPQRDLFQYRLPNSLKRCINKEIFVSIKIKRHFIRGILREFDMHLNLVMKDAKEVIYKRGGEKIVERGDLLVRGDSIIYIDFDGKREYLLNKPKENEQEIIADVTDSPTEVSNENSEVKSEENEESSETKEAIPENSENVNTQ